MAVAQAQWETLFGDSFTGTPDLPQFMPGDKVFKIAEFASSEASWSGGRYYTVKAFVLRTFDDSGTERFADESLDTEVTNAGTPPGDTTTGWRYIIESSTSQVTEEVHESEIRNESDTETYVGTQTADFISTS